MSGAQLATSEGSPSTHRGFSLLELLVALFVIVLITSVVTLNIGPGDRDILLEAKLRNLMEVAAYGLDEAQILGLDYGLLLQQDNEQGIPVYAYAWRERGPEGWRLPRTGKEVFASQRFPEDVELSLELEDVPEVEIGPVENDVETAPQVVLYASGETTAGAIDVRHAGSGELLWRVEWDLLGRFKLLRGGEEEAPL